MPLFHCLTEVIAEVCEPRPSRLLEHLLCVIVELGLVSLERQNIVSVLLNYSLRYLLLTSHRVYCDCASRHVQSVKQLWYRRYLIGVVVNLDLT